LSRTTCLHHEIQKKVSVAAPASCLGVPGRGQPPRPAVPSLAHRTKIVCVRHSLRPSALCRFHNTMRASCNPPTYSMFQKSRPALSNRFPEQNKKTKLTPSRTPNAGGVPLSHFCERLARKRLAASPRRWFASKSTSGSAPISRGGNGILVPTLFVGCPRETATTTPSGKGMSQITIKFHSHFGGVSRVCEAQ